MDIIRFLTGTDKDLDSLQMSIRAFVIFFLALLMLRIAGVRTFGKKSAFDNVVIIMLGAILSRAVVGSSPFIPTVAASLVIVIVHWALGAISFRSDKIGRLVKGKRTLLFRDNEPQAGNMQRVQISSKDIMEELRLQLNQEALENIDEVWLERTGQISITLKKKLRE